MTKDKAAIYVRLSRDEDQEDYDSIITQKNALQKYAKDHNIEVYKIFEDDGYSGYLFDKRPAFNEMIKDLRNDIIQIVIAKDLSRIGRNNPRTLLFLEEMTELDKRVILVDDNYDSEKDRDDILPLRSYFNEMYVKDISRKTRFNLKHKQLNGDILIRATFGYKKEGDKKEGFRLVIDNETAPIVKEIFRLYREGYGYRKIANIMNEKKYPTPSVADGKKRATTHLWNSTHISRILKNEVYTGTHVLRKTIRKSIKSKELIKVPQEEWIRIKNHHESIISVDEFQRVQMMLDNRNENTIRAGSDRINLFAGFIYCADCGSPMFCIKNKRFATHYQCGNYHKYGLNVCCSHRIMEKSLIVTLTLEIKNIIKKLNENLQSMETLLESKAKVQKNFTATIDKLQKEIENKKKEKTIIYKDKVKGIIDEEMYLELVGEIEVNLKTLTNQLEEFRKLQDDSEKSKEMIKSYLDIMTASDEIINRELLERVLKRIEVNKDKEIELIRWNAFLESINE